MMSSSLSLAAKRGFDSETWLQRAIVACGVIFLLLALLFPLFTMLVKSLESRAGDFIGLSNFSAYFSNPALTESILNSLNIATWTTVIVVSTAFVFAYALTHSGMAGKKGFRLLTLLPLFAPSLLPALSMIYLFGNQGILRDWLPADTIYGPVGIIMGLSFWAFPHALMILITAFSNSDARLYEAARSMNTPRWRVFLTVTLPSVRYGLINTVFVIFTLTITDFGVAKVIGGQYNVLATDIYKQVVGQQNFQMGAVVSVILLLPALVSFMVERRVQRHQSSQLSARAVPLQPDRSPLRDLLLTLFCTLVCGFLVLVVGMAVYASFITFWPYNMTLSLNNYQFDMMDGGGWASYFNSVQMSLWTALTGTAVVFLVAYISEKIKPMATARRLLQLLAMLPMAVPGIVLGLAYIFFFNQPDNPLNLMYGTMAILVLNTLVHFYTVCHLTAVTSLKQIDSEFEAVSASLKVPFYTTLRRVTLPLALPAVLDISVYLFVNAMTTVSAVVFLYSSETTLASVAVMHMDEAGDTAPAAAMAVLLMLTSLVAKALHWLISRQLLQRTQRWRQP